MNIAFAVLGDVIVSDAVENSAGFFRISIGIGKVDDGAGFTFTDDRELVFQIFDSTVVWRIWSARNLDLPQQECGRLLERFRY